MNACEYLATIGFDTLIETRTPATDEDNPASIEAARMADHAIAREKILAQPKPRLKRIQIPSPDGVIEAIIEECEKSGETVAEWCRGAIADKLKTKLPPLVQGRPPLKPATRKKKSPARK